jgi:hypothetical protein
VDRPSFHVLIAALWLTAWANDIGVLVGSSIERHRRETKVCRYVVGPSVQSVPVGNPHRARDCPLLLQLR